MYDLDWFWGEVSFSLAFLAGSLLVCSSLEKKKHFYLRILIIYLLMFLVQVCYRPFFYNYYEAVQTSFLKIFLFIPYLLQYIIVIVGIYQCFETSKLASLFAATLGYCFQHITERSYEILMNNFFSDRPLLIWFIVLTLITVIPYALIYFLYLRKITKEDFDLIHDYTGQVFLSFVVTAVAIFLNGTVAYLGYDSVNSTAIVCWVYFFSILVCFITVILEFTVLKARKVRKEKEILSDLVMQKKSQYEKEKETMELLNVKYHDIMHILKTNNANVDTNLQQEINNSLHLYQSFLKTGNEAMDVLLGKKSQECQMNHIRFTCLCDGKKLSFIPPYETYALFENIMDNAIEACKELPEEKRIISLTTSEKNGIFFIHENNYYEGEIVFEKGLPKTKGDKNYHGYGSKSIRMIAQKYHGDLAIMTEKDIFSLEITFPLPEELKN